MTDADQETFLGADCGGSGTRVLLADGAGVPLARATGEPANPCRMGARKAARSLHALLAEVLAGRRPAAAVVGMSGASHPAARDVVARAFAGLPTPARWLLVDDLRIAWEAAGLQAGGVLILAGTGSGALARGHGGWCRRGGGGPLLGDEGGGVWMVRLALKEAFRSSQGRSPATSLAQRLCLALGAADPSRLPAALQAAGGVPTRLFPVVASCAESGDATACRILEQGARHLALLARQAAAAAGLTRGAPVATAGGVLDSGFVRRLLGRSLQEHGLAPGVHVEEPVRGAVSLALRDQRRR